MSYYGFPITAAFGRDPAAPRFYDLLTEDPEALGLPADFGDVLLYDDDVEEDDDDAPVGEQHNAHVAAYHAHKEREAHVAALHGGVATIWDHLDGSPGCTKLGCDEEFLHVRHTWADEADILATPFEPTDQSPFSPATGYPHCTLPWTWWPPVVGGRRSALLFIFRIWRAHRVVTAQIAAAGGLDDDRGWITRPAAPDLSDLAEWRRGLFLPPSQRAAAKKAARTAAKKVPRKAPPVATRPAEQRHTAAKPAADERPKAPQGPRPITVEGDRAFVLLTRGYVAAIAAADIPLVEGHDWQVATPAGKTPFAVRTERLPGGGKRGIRMNRIEGLTGPVEIIAPCASELADHSPVS